MAYNKVFSLLLLFVLGSVGNGNEIGETNMVFYVQGNIATETIVGGVNGSSSDFGKFGTSVVIDDLVTQLPQNDSNVLGKAKGIYLYADADASRVRTSTPMLIITILFQNDKNNSDSYDTLQLQGVDDLYGSQREVSVVGGTGKFRFATGYAIITTEAVDVSLSVLKFDVTIRPLMDSRSF